MVEEEFSSQLRSAEAGYLQGRYTQMVLVVWFSYRLYTQVG